MVQKGVSITLPFEVRSQQLVDSYEESEGKAFQDPELVSLIATGMGCWKDRRGHCGGIIIKMAGNDMG